jgi:hypothetical protein
LGDFFYALIVDCGQVPFRRTMPIKLLDSLKQWPWVASFTPVILLFVTAPVHAQTWAAVDALRTKLTSHGVKVIQKNCSTRGLQGAYHPKNDILIVCRTHRNAAQVWNTLAHEATHRMQACAGGSITLPSQHRMMSRVLRRETPQEWKSIRAYPRGQHLAELEARYTAKLPANDVMKLFDRYCGSTVRV